ncbi:MAG: carbohydrate kinase [Hungatella hathewayi]|nr:carbohydrate kinase [Hungatella hathewayi]
MFDVTALGEILIDFTPCGEREGVPVYAQNPGGAPLNVLVQNSLLGGKTAFIGKVGRDGFGSALRKVMEDHEIDTRGLSVSEEVHTTLAFVQLDSDGERSFSFYRNPGADILLKEEDIDGGLIRDSHIFHFGSLSATSEPSRSATCAALEIARKAGCIITYDPNYRAPLWKSEREAVETMLHFMPYADILKVSEEEMELLTGTQDIETGSRTLADYGITLVCVSRGAMGACFRRGDDYMEVPGFAVDTVDTNGAGDSFFGAIQYQLREKNLEDLKQMPVEQLAEIIRFANAAGARTTMKKGAIPAMADGETIAQFLYHNCS